MVNPADSHVLVIERTANTPPPLFTKSDVAPSPQAGSPREKMADKINSIVTDDNENVEKILLGAAVGLVATHTRWQRVLRRARRAGASRNFDGVLL